MNPEQAKDQIEEVKELELKKGKKPKTKFTRPGDEEKENRRLMKKYENIQKDKEIKRRALLREKNERKALKLEANKMKMVLIYPLISYKDEIFINDHVDEETKNFKKEIEEKKAQ